MLSQASDAGQPTPEFSVLIAACNAEGTLADTLESLLAQTVHDWEACIVDRRLLRRDRARSFSAMSSRTGGSAQNHKRTVGAAMRAIEPRVLPGPSGFASWMLMTAISR